MPATVREAAAAEGISPAQVRRDIANGAPVVRRGSPGPGNGALLDLPDYRCWRNREYDEGRTLERIAAGLVDMLTRDGGEGEPAHITLGIPRRAAVVYLALVYERLHLGVTGRPADSLPAEIEHEVRGLSDL